MVLCIGGYVLWYIRRHQRSLAMCRPPGAPSATASKASVSEHSRRLTTRPVAIRAQPEEPNGGVNGRCGPWCAVPQLLHSMLVLKIGTVWARESVFPCNLSFFLRFGCPRLNTMLLHDSV